MRSGVTLRQAKAFLLASDLLSFSRAAEAMHISHSAFSQLIREFEAELELQLFDRTTRRVMLTGAGAAIRERLARGVADVDGACMDARSIARVEHGQIIVGALASIAIGLVARALGDLRRTHPNIKVGLREDHNGSLIQRVREGELEFALCAASKEMDDLQFEPLFDDELVAVLRDDDPLVESQTLRWASLHNIPLVMTVSQSSTRQQIVDGLLANGIKRTIDYDVGNMFSALSMVREGFGMTFVPTFTLPDCVMRDLTYRRMKQPTPRRRIGLCCLEGKSMSPAAKKFETILRAHVKAAGLALR